MKLRWSWDPRAFNNVGNFPLAAQQRIDRAVIRFAETGEGDVVWEPPHHVLRVGLYDITLAIDPSAEVLSVITVRRARAR